MTVAAATAWTLIYWLIGLMFLGLALLGDCIDVDACERSKRAILTIGLTIEVGLYVGLMAIFIWRRRS